MINQFNEKGHPMVFGEESVNTNHLIEKCRAAIASLTHQHGLAERLAEACFMIALSELENNWKKHAEAAEAEAQRLNANAQPVSDGLYRIANHIAGAKNALPQEWQDWAEEIKSDLRKLASTPGGQ
ncbi:hypothetical protein [Pantoea ananatis]|uniref:hypothetical protein n=1 Tax=Pantoea ananas TaxID=553 RepID=UPI001B308A8A|nr:hypothetical protein [Pantoea ananatis]